MNLSLDVSQHLARFNDLNRLTAEAAKRFAAERESHISDLRSLVAERLRTDAMPAMEAIAKAIREYGHLAAVLFTPSLNNGPDSWIVAVSVNFACAPVDAPHPLYDVTFLGEVDPAAERWRLRSYSLSHELTGLEEETYEPGSGTIEAFAKKRVMAVFRAAFPIQNAK
jgi:hypothetical protein